VIESRLATSLRNILAARPVMLRPCACLMAGAACSSPVHAAPAPEPGAHALLDGAAASRARAPVTAEFDSDFLSGQGRKVDLSVFANGNPMVAGSYRVDIYVNGVWQGRRDVMFKADSQGDVAACLSLAQLEELGVDTQQLADGTRAADAATDDCVPVHKRMQDAYGRYDSASLRYDVSIPQTFMRRQARGYVNPALWDRGINAGFVGYNFNVLDSDVRTVGGQSNRNAYLGLNLGLNLGGWQLRQDSNLTWREGAGSHWQRISTYAQRGIAPIRGMLTIGEAFSNGELFDSVGYRGVSLVSDDRMLPDSLRGYAPVVRGIAETNARVEIRQNQQLIYSSTVSPGAFVIEDLYPTGYGGDLEVRVIEADGRNRQFKVPFGSVAQMLRPGISRYAITAGEVRSDRLLDEPWLLQGIYQRGIGNQLTLYAGAALSEGYSSLLYGAGISTPLGAFAADVTHARTQLHFLGDRQGASVRLSYSSLFSGTGTSLTLAAYRYSTRGFYSLQDALYARDAVERGFGTLAQGRQRSQFQLTMNQPLGQRYGALYLTGSVRDFYDRPGTSTQYQLGYNTAWRRLNLGVSALRTEEGIFGRNDTQYLLSVNMPLGRGDRPVSFSTDIGARQHGGYDSSRVGITGSAGRDNALSYGLAVTDSRQGSGNAVANMAYQGRYAAMTASYGYSNDFRQLSLGASGSIVGHGGGLTFTPQRGETMVLVQAPGAVDAHLTNAPGLRIDGRGYAVVPYVSPYRLNTVTLDPQDMARDVELESSSQSIAPYAGAISYLKFQTRKGRAVLIQLRDTQGGFLPLGAQAADVQGQTVGMMGQGGRLYMRTELERGHLVVSWGEAEDQRCGVDYQLPAETEGAALGFIKLEATCR